MNTPIGITPNELISIILAMCGGIITVSGAVTVLINWVNKAKRPNQIQNERLDKLEADMKLINERLVRGNVRFDKDSERIDRIEKEMSTANRVILESLQALTAHAIDGNNTGSLQESKKRLDNYLINKV